MAPVYVKAAFAAGLPFALLLLNGSIFALLRVLKLSRAPFRRFSQTSLMLLNLIHPFIVKAVLQLVSCKEVDNKTLWLSADISIQCWTVSHYKYVLGLFLPTFIVVVIGIPLLFAVLLLRMRSSIYSHFFIFLTSGFEEEFYYWEVVLTARKALLLLALSLLGSAPWIMQNLVTTFLLYCSLEWHLRVSPYHDPVHNRLETASIFLQMGLIAVSFYFNADIKLNESIQLMMGMLLFVLLVLFVLLCLAVAGAQILLKRKRTKTTIAPTRPTLDLGIKPPPTSFVSLERSMHASLENSQSK